jgi:hypothetical protein
MPRTRAKLKVELEAEAARLIEEALAWIAEAPPRNSSARTRKAQPPRPPTPPGDLLVVYATRLELEVADTSTAARLASDIAYNYGGYLVSSQSNLKYTTLTLAILAAQFDAARRSLLSLGTLRAERVSGDLVGAGSGATEWNIFSNITIELHPSAYSYAPPPAPRYGWSPARTFEKAFGVFASIFRFLIDAVIWLAVVVGPFVLMGLGMRALLRRQKSQ